MDCLGCMVLPPLAVGLPFEDYTTYARSPNPKQLLREVARRMDLVSTPGDSLDLVSDLRGVALAASSTPRVGDVGACWLNPALRGRPHHAFMLVPGPRAEDGLWMVHAWMEAGRVAYNPYAGAWPEATHSFWRYRGLED